MGRPFAKQLPETHHGPIVQLGDGEIGGKARGLGFLAAQLDLFELGRGFAPHRIVVPESTVLGTDLFDEFVGGNGLDALRGRADDEIRARFLETPLAPELQAALSRFVLTVSPLFRALSVSTSLLDPSLSCTVTSPLREVTVYSEPGRLLERKRKTGRRRRVIFCMRNYFTHPGTGESCKELERGY